MALIDLPDVEFVSDDVTETLDNVLKVYSALSGRTLAPGDPARILLQALCVIIVQQRKLINLTAQQNLLKYARGPILDNMGAFTDTPRLPASAARTTLRFTLSAPQLSAVAIPVGTRASTQSDPKRYFATTEYAEVQAGQTTVDVSAECTETGDVGNGFLAGQINQIVDPLPFVLSVANTTASAGGADEESDDSYRERIHIAPESFSVAGPTGSYEYWAKTASQSIIDVSVDSPSAGTVRIVPLLEGGVVPGQEILDAVAEICNDKTIRPLTDLVTVVAPESVSYDITLTYWISRDRAADATAIQTAVNQAVSDYALWQKSKLGRDINPSELIYKIINAGALRVSVTNPVYTEIELDEVAVANTPSITYGGLADD